MGLDQQIHMKMRHFGHSSKVDVMVEKTEAWMDEEGLKALRT